MVWLSPTGLKATNGNGWTDICPDWSVEGAGLTNLGGAVLHDNQALYRLELYSGLTRYDFYYHPSLLKDGKFRMMGPTTMNVAVTTSATGELNGQNASWVTSSTVIQRQNTINDKNQMELTGGQIHPKNPMQQLKVTEVALTHNAQNGESGTIQIESKITFEDSSTESVAIDLSRDETTPNDFAGGGHSGNWVKLGLTLSEFGEHAAGPMWIRADIMEDGDG